jgi:hypothetical protein
LLNDAAHSTKTETSSPAPPNSIGGQNPSNRTNHSEIVSDHRLYYLWRAGNALQRSKARAVRAILSARKEDSRYQQAEAYTRGVLAV